jgi:hypothetical protein
MTMRSAAAFLSVLSSRLRSWEGAVFLALSHTLGYEAVFVEGRARQRDDLQSLDDVTTEQLGELIDSWVSTRNAGRRERHADKSFRQYAGSMNTPDMGGRHACW